MAAQDSRRFYSVRMEITVNAPSFMTTADVARTVEFEVAGLLQKQNQENHAKIQPELSVQYGFGLLGAAPHVQLVTQAACGSR